MVGLGVLILIIFLAVFGISCALLVDGFSTYFWTEPILVLLFFGSLAMLLLGIWLIKKGVTGEGLLWGDKEKAVNRNYQRVVKKYEWYEHFTNPQRKDLRRIYDSEGQFEAYDMFRRDAFKVLPSNRYYRLLCKGDPYVEIANAHDCIDKLWAGWQEKLQLLEEYAAKGYHSASVALYQIYHYGVKKEGEKDQIKKNEKLALKYLTPAVKAGYVHAQEQLIWAAAEEEDYAKAQRLISKYELRMAHVAYCYWGDAFFYGWGVEVDYERALVYYKQSNFGKYTIFQRAKTLEQLHRYDEALEIYRDIAKLDDSYGIANYARLLGTELGKQRKAYKILRKRYQSGDESNSIILQLAYLLAEGIGCEKDIEEATSLYKILADKGDSAAINNLAAAYDCGASHDPKEVFALYLKAAESGGTASARAASNVGRMYFNGIGVAKNQTKALEYFEKAAAQNDENGLAWLGHCYAKGIGVAKNTDKAIALWKRAEHGEGCQYHLGELYYTLKRYMDAEKYLLLFLETIDRKNIRSKYEQEYKNVNFRLGFLYSEKKQYDEAIPYWEEAADCGDATSMHNLAVLYERGWGVEKNQETANLWHEKARAAGYQDKK